MKKSQQNFTTTEQSKRLLELGVPADSADCYLNSDSVIMLNGKTFQENYNEDLDLARLHLIEYPHYVPCWSIGRLIEIILLCPHRRNVTISKGYDPIESLINQLVMLREVGTDFSKLEELWK